MWYQVETLSLKASLKNNILPEVPWTPFANPSMYLSIYASVDKNFCATNWNC